MKKQSINNKVLRISKDKITVLNSSEIRNVKGGASTLLWHLIHFSGDGCSAPCMAIANNENDKETGLIYGQTQFYCIQTQGDNCGQVMM